VGVYECVLQRVNQWAQFNAWALTLQICTGVFSKIFLSLYLPSYSFSLPCLSFSLCLSVFIFHPIPVPYIRSLFTLTPFLLIVFLLSRLLIYTDLVILL
jgi:hypothetical protein